VAVAGHGLKLFKTLLPETEKDRPPKQKRVLFYETNSN
jgi:hypothetical protein